MNRKNTTRYESHHVADLPGDRRVWFRRRRGERTWTFRITHRGPGGFEISTGCRDLAAAQKRFAPLLAALAYEGAAGRPVAAAAGAVLEPHGDRRGATPH